MNRKFRIMIAAAALSLMVLPVSCGMGDGNNSNGMNQNGIYDGSNGRNALRGAGEVIDDAGDAIERGADRIQNGLDNLDDGMTNTLLRILSTKRKACQSKTGSASSLRSGGRRCPIILHKQKIHEDRGEPEQ